MIDTERKRIEKEFSKSEGESVVKGGKRRAAVSPKPKKAAKKGKKAVPTTLLKDSETVGSTTTPPRAAEIEGEVNQEKVVEKEADKSADVSGKEVSDVGEVAKTSEIIKEVWRDVQEQDIEDEQAIDAQDHSLKSKDPEIEEEKEVEVDTEAAEEDVDISDELQRFNRWWFWKLSRSRLQADIMEDMHSEEDWVMSMIVADYQLHELINADNLLKFFKTGVAITKTAPEKKDDNEKKDDGDDSDDDDDDDAPHGAEKDAQADEHDKQKEAEKGVEEDDDDDDVLLSHKYPTLTTNAIQKKIDDEVVEVENLEKEEEDKNDFSLDESTVCAYTDEEGNVIQLDQENLEAWADIIAEDAAHKLIEDFADKIELEEVAALAAKLDEEDDKAEAAAAAKTKKQKTYSRKRKVARKSARNVMRKIVLEEEEIDDIVEEAAAKVADEIPKDDHESRDTDAVIEREIPKDGDVLTSSREIVEEDSEKQLTVFHEGLSFPLAEPIGIEEAAFEDAPVRNEVFTAVCAKFEQTIRSMIAVNKEQRNALKEVWTELDKYTHFDNKLKAQMCSTLLRIEQNDEGRNECMMQTLDVLRVLPKILETHRDFLHNRIKELVTTNLSNCQVIEKKIENSEKQTDRKIERLTAEMKELTENVAKSFENSDEKMKGVEKALIQIIATQEEHSRNQSELTSYFKDFLMDTKKGEEMFSKDGKSGEGSTLKKEFIEGSSTLLKTFEGDKQIADPQTPAPFEMKHFDEFRYQFYDVGRWNKANFADAFF
ncbi:hypothetical protein Dimus_038294 [Dionaea muscipula]